MWRRKALGNSVMGSYYPTLESKGARARAAELGEALLAGIWAGAKTVKLRASGERGGGGAPRKWALSHETGKECCCSSGPACEARGKEIMGRIV